MRKYARFYKLLLFLFIIGISLMAILSLLEPQLDNECLGWFHLLIHRPAPSELTEKVWTLQEIRNNEYNYVLWTRGPDEDPAEYTLKFMADGSLTGRECGGLAYHGPYRLYMAGRKIAISGGYNNMLPCRDTQNVNLIQSLCQYSPYTLTANRLEIVAEDESKMFIFTTDPK